MPHRAACRCGAVAFEVDGDQAGHQAGDRQDGAPGSAGVTGAPAAPEGALAARLPPAHAGFASVLWAVPRACIRMQPPEPAIGAFTYSGWLVGHRFCAVCGMHLFGEEIVEDGASGALPMAYVNRECLDCAGEPVDAGIDADRSLEPASSE